MYFRELGWSEGNRLVQNLQGQVRSTGTHCWFYAAAGGRTVSYARNLSLCRY